MRPIIFDFCEVVHQTEKAVKIKAQTTKDGKLYTWDGWVAKSQICLLIDEPIALNILKVQVQP